LHGRLGGGWLGSPPPSRPNHGCPTALVQSMAPTFIYQLHQIASRRPIIVIGTNRFQFCFKVLSTASVISHLSTLGHQASYTTMLIQVHGAISKSQGKNYGGLPRRPPRGCRQQSHFPLHSGGSWVPSLELVHNTIQDGTHGLATNERGNLV
jgi:hypothetical protein